MKRISRFALVTLFSLLVLGSTRVFAGDGGNQGKNYQGNNKGGNNNQGNNGGIIGWIDNLLNDLFGNDNKGGNNNGNNNGNNGGNNWGTNPTAGGGGTAPIDGGITLLLGAGIGLGLTKVVRIRRA